MTRRPHPNPPLIKGLAARHAGGRTVNPLINGLASGLLLLTDRVQAGEALVEVVAAAVEGGARQVVLREKDLPRDRRAALAVQLRAVLVPAGGLLIAAGTDPLAGRAVHLASTDPPLPADPTVPADPTGPSVRADLIGPSVQADPTVPADPPVLAGPPVPPVPPVPVDPGDLRVPAGLSTGGLSRPVDSPFSVDLVGRSCHREADLRRLSTEDYVTLSPVFPSPSKPGYGPPLGLAGLARLCAASPVPVFALGGVTTPEQAAACIAAGARGVAVMGAVMRAPDPAAAVATLLSAISHASATRQPAGREVVR